MSGFDKVLDELAQVVRVQPECDSAIAALSYIAERDASQRERVANVLQEVLSTTTSARNSQAKSRVNISLATLDPGATKDRRKLLEDAVLSDPGNAEAILQLTQDLLAEENPDHSRVEQMIRKALRSCDQIYHPDLYHRLGEVQVHHENWQGAIVSLRESSIRGISQGVRASIACLCLRIHRASRYSSTAPETSGKKSQVSRSLDGDSNEKK